MRRDFIWAGLFATLAAAIAIAGQPKPLSLITAGAAAITAGYIAARALDRQPPP